MLCATWTGSSAESHCTEQNGIKQKARLLEHQGSWKWFKSLGMPAFLFFSSPSQKMETHNGPGGNLGGPVWHFSKT